MTESVTVTTTITRMESPPFPTGTGGTGTAVPSAPHYRRSLEMRGLGRYEVEKEKEKRGWWGWFG